jgi:phosphatidylinositol alpha-1,6-mannosyltransferase
LSAAELIVANSEFTRRLVMEMGTWRQEVVVVHPPFRSPQTPPLDGTRLDGKFGLQGRRLILTVGRLFKRKGHANVIEAFARLATSYPALTYVIAGIGPELPNITRLVAEHGLVDRIRLIGLASDDDLDALYRRAEVFVSPSLDDDGDVEGFGIAFLEAAARGTPAIAGRSGGAAEAVIDQQTGLVVDGSNVAEVTSALARLLDDQPLRARLGAAARVRAEEHFSVSAQSARFLRALELARNRFQPTTSASPYPSLLAGLASRALRKAREW